MRRILVLLSIALLVFYLVQSGEVWTGMHASALVANVQQIWENKPQLILILGLGFVVFICVVVDAWRHKQTKRRKHPPRF